MKRKLTGRPVMAEGKRTKKIDARFTEIEYKLVLQMEKTLGIRKTDLVRSAVLKDGAKIVINAKEMIRQLDEIGTQLGRSGSNINQLARYANILMKQNVLSPVVVNRFNLLFETYIANQKDLETVLRKVIRSLGR